VALVLRGKEVIVPRGSTPLRPGDQVCCFVTPESRTILDLLFGTAERDPA
jgi:NhaP-type Na+/H+ and K+/H+ antiporter